MCAILLCCACTGEVRAKGSKELFAYIKAHYPYNDGYLGADWCFNVETSLYDFWWYTNLAKKGLYAVHVDHGARIQTIYAVDPKNPQGKWNYGSIFLSVEVGPDTLYPPAKAQPQVPPSGDGNLEIKSPPCMTPEQFLDAYFLPYDMTFSDSIDLTKPAPQNDDFSTDDDTYYRYWEFAGRYHRVTHIARIKIKLTDSNGNGHDAYFVLGYGGGAGP
jgi:hypothetical protein